ncbi:hypothetical protein, partial [Geminisphaera colitermitum]|uniref:hypothetical protein n=1 Tax=Geminisphaera colitermitum TaxID=1148786 RepID=UPI001E3754E0
MPATAATTAAVRRLLTGIAPHGRRIAIQAGEAVARILLARREVSGLRIEKLITIDLAADGLLTPEEMARRLGQILATLPPAPVALSLPLGRSHSQIMDLPPGDTRAAHPLVQTIGGRQFEQVPSIYDSRPLKPFGPHARPAWITIAREADVDLQLLRCGLAAGDVTHITSADGALSAAFAEVSARPPSAVLIELGAVASTLVLVLDHQTVFSASIDTGSGALLAALATDLRCPADEAEIVLKREGPAVVSPATPQLQAALQRWHHSIETLLREHAREAGIPPDTLLELPRWFSGAQLADPGVRALLETHAGGHPAQHWPDIAVGDDGRAVSLAACAIAYGVAAISSGLQPAPANLLPPAARELRRTRQKTTWLHAALLTALVLGAALVTHAWAGRLASVRAKQERVALLEHARDAGPRLTEEFAAREQAYLEATPALYLQKRTRDLLTGIRTLSTARTAHAPTADFWFAVIADAETYVGGAIPQGTPAAAPETQFLRGCFARPTGLVVELSLPPSNKDHLGSIGTLVQNLRATHQFTSVDILPVRARQPLADPSVFAPKGGDFALALETAPYEHNLPPPPPSRQRRPQHPSTPRPLRTITPIHPLFTAHCPLFTVPMHLHSQRLFYAVLVPLAVLLIVAALAYRPLVNREAVLDQQLAELQATLIR